MKAYQEYLEAPRQRFEDAPAEIQEKIKRLCGITKKLLVQDVSASEHDFLWKKVNEILNHGLLGKKIAEIEKYLPTAQFCCSDFVELPNGVILEDEGRWMQLFTKETALAEFERCAEHDEWYFKLCDEADEYYPDEPYEDEESDSYEFDEQ